MSIAVSQLCSRFNLDIDDLELQADLGNSKAQVAFGVMRVEQGDFGGGMVLCSKGIAGLLKTNQDAATTAFAVINTASSLDENEEALQELYYMLTLLLGAVTGKPTYKLILDWARPLANRGSRVCQRILGEMYADGNGVEQDYWEAVKYLRMAADNDDNKAQFRLGKMYLNGEGVQQDNEKAVSYLIDAVSNGNADAASLIGSIYFKGEEYEEAAKFLLIAAKKGNSDAQCVLGMMFERGIGVERNHFEAVRWLREAAKSGNTGARNQLAQLGIYD